MGIMHASQNPNENKSSSLQEAGPAGDGFFCFGGRTFGISGLWPLCAGLPFLRRCCDLGTLDRRKRRNLRASMTWYFRGFFIIDLLASRELLSSYVGFFFDVEAPDR